MIWSASSRRAVPLGEGRERKTVGLEFALGPSRPEGEFEPSAAHLVNLSASLGQSCRVPICHTVYENADPGPAGDECQG